MIGWIFPFFWLKICVAVSDAKHLGKETGHPKYLTQKKQKPSIEIKLIDCVEDPGIMEMEIIPNNRPPQEKDPDICT